MGGPALVSEHLVLRVLAMMVPMFVFVAAMEFLVAVDELRFRLLCEGVAMTLMVAGGLIVIPVAGAAGMAALSVLAYGIAGTLALTRLAGRGAIEVGPLLRECGRLAARALPCLALLAVPGLPWWAATCLYWAVVPVVLTWTRFWDDDDRRLLAACRRRSEVDVLA
jgi:hypothetical protein